MATKSYGRTEGFCWLGIGAAICFIAWKAHLGSFQEPGPGFVAFAAGLFISIVGLIRIGSQTLSKTTSSDDHDFSTVFRDIAWLKLGYITCLLFGYALLLGRLGYILTTFLLMWALFYSWDRKHLILSLLISLITVAVSYLIFEVWLFCQLPRGILPWW